MPSLSTLQPSTYLCLYLLKDSEHAIAAELNSNSKETCCLLKVFLGLPPPGTTYVFELDDDNNSNGENDVTDDVDCCDVKLMIIMKTILWQLTLCLWGGGSTVRRRQKP